MQIQRIGYGIRCFGRITDSVWKMVERVDEPCRRILAKPRSARVRALAASGDLDPQHCFFFGYQMKIVAAVRHDDGLWAKTDSTSYFKNYAVKTEAETQR